MKGVLAAVCVLVRFLLFRYFYVSRVGALLRLEGGTLLVGEVSR